MRLTNVSDKKLIVLMALMGATGIVADVSFAQQLAPVPSAGTAAPADPSLQDPKAAQSQASVEKFDDWYFRCVDIAGKGGASAKSCEVAQIATVKQGDQDVNVLTLAIARSADGGAVSKTEKAAKKELTLTTLVPLNMFLPAGVRVDVGDKQIAQIPYRNCNQTGCWSQQKLDAKMIAALEKASEGSGQVQMMNGQKVNIRFSLKGLAAALDRLEKTASN